MSEMLKFVALVAALSLTACANVRAPQPEAPALWVVRDSDSAVYLYGSTHVLRAGEAWGAPHVEAALQAADDVWTEVDMSPEADARAQALAMQRGMGAARPLSSLLAADDRARLAAQVERLGLPAPAVEQMHPWMAAVVLTGVSLRRAGYDPEAGVDRAVDAWARGRGRTMHAFETAERQLSFFFSMSEENQLTMLRQTLAELEAGDAKLAAAAAAWRRGDVDAEDTLLLSEMRARFPAFYRLFIVNRTAAFADAIAQEMAGAGSDFVVVGAAHLVGEEGLPAQMRARGFAVERVPAR